MNQIPHTEVVVLPLISNSDPNDPQSAISKAITLNNTLTAAQPGYQRGAWGIKGSEQKALVTFTDWDDISCHQDFMAHSDHEHLLSVLLPVVNGPIQMFHTSLTLSPGTTVTSKVTSGPVVIAMGFFPLQDTRDDLICRPDTTDINSPTSIMHPGACACGWSMEDGSFWSNDLAQVERPGKGLEKVWVAIYRSGEFEDQRRAHMADLVRWQTEWIVEEKGERQIDELTLSGYCIL
ncbi:hypothetical protein Q7P37_002912 [Cladosporium fusiforme]